MSRLIRIFTVCVVYLFIISIIELRNKQGGSPNLAVFPNIPDFTLNATKQPSAEKNGLRVPHQVPSRWFIGKHMFLHVILLFIPPLPKGYVH